MLQAVGMLRAVLRAVGMIRDVDARRWGVTTERLEVPGLRGLLPGPSRGARLSSSARPAP